MGRAVAPVPDRVMVAAVLMDRVMVAAILILASRVIKEIKAIMAVIISSLAREINSSNLGIRVTQSS